MNRNDERKVRVPYPIKRIGGNAWHHTTFRLVCGTNRNLWAQVQRGEFRADLYFRIAGFICRPRAGWKNKKIQPQCDHLGFAAGNRKIFNRADKLKSYRSKQHRH